MKKIVVFFAFLLSLDIFSKMGAIEWIPPMGPFEREYPFGGIPVFQIFNVSFSLNYVINTGAAWGLFAGHSGLLFGLRSLIILGLVSYLLFPKKGEGLSKFSAWLIVTGAIGNAIDYVLYGHVIDFFHFTFWGRSFPVFNLADSYITLGAMGLLFIRPPQKTS